MSLAKRSPQTDTSILWISFLGVLMVTKKKEYWLYGGASNNKDILDNHADMITFYRHKSLFSYINICVCHVGALTPFWNRDSLFMQMPSVVVKKTWPVIAREKKGFRTSKSSYFNIYIISTKVKRLLIVFHTSFNTSKAKTPFCSSVFHRASHHHWACKENKVDGFHWSVVGTKEV